MKLSLIVSSARILLSCVPSAFSIEVSVQRTFVWPVSLCAFLQVDSIVVVFEAPHLYCLTLESIAPTRSFVSCSFYSFAIFCLWPWMCHPVYLVEWIQHQSWLSCRLWQWRAGEVLCHLDQNLFNKFIDDVTSTSPVLIEVEVRKKRYRQVVSYAPPQYLSFLFLLNVLHHSY